MSQASDHTGANFVKTIVKDTYPTIDPKQWTLRGAVIVITGASRGIGRATALSYAAAGASGIVLAARSAQALDEVETAIYSIAKGAAKPIPKVLKFVLDVADNANIEAAAKKTEETFGRVDVVINNAGYMMTWNNVAESDPEDWWKVFELNLRGPYLVTRAFLPLMLKSERGSKVFVNMSSNGAHRIDPGASAYEISKLAVLRLTEFITAEYSNRGVVAISVHPGVVETAMSGKLPEGIGLTLEDTPELAGDTIVWLTKESREWLNGRYVSCTWDVHELESKKVEIVAGDKLKVALIV